MGRAERRRLDRQNRYQPKPRYGVTKYELDRAVTELTKEKIEETKRIATEDAVNSAMVLLLSLPIKVLMDHYWQKSASKKVPEFVEYLLDYYRKWQDGEIKLEDLEKELWEVGGVRLEQRVE